MISLLNLWLFFVPGYGVIWASMAWASRKRGKPIEDPEFFKMMPEGKKFYTIGVILLIAQLLVSLFTPLNFGTLFWIGLPFYLAGIILNLVAMYSFAHFSDGVNTTGIYRYSRHPMYTGGHLFLLGLCLIGWSESAWSIAFLILFIISVPYSHWAALLEEAFLERKYGKAYLEYKQKVPRYLLF